MGLANPAKPQYSNVYHTPLRSFISNSIRKSRAIRISRACSPLRSPVQWSNRRRTPVRPVHEGTGENPLCPAPGGLPSPGPGHRWDTAVFCMDAAHILSQHTHASTGFALPYKIRFAVSRFTPRLPVPISSKARSMVTGVSCPLSNNRYWFCCLRWSATSFMPSINPAYCGS